MTQKNELTPHSKQISLGKRMLIGAWIGLLVISFFIFPISNPDPAWGKYWMIRPLLVVPFAGAMGGLCNYILVQFHYVIGINKVVAIVISAIVFIVGLWMGIVLGLVGTLWN